jgi:hypothetical protein
VTLSPFDFLILVIATWRLAHLISSESAPFNVMGRFRERFPLGGGSACIKCASVWTAAALLLLWFTPLNPLVWIAALSGAALMLGSYTGASHV